MIGYIYICVDSHIVVRLLCGYKYILSYFKINSFVFNEKVIVLLVELYEIRNV